MSPVRLVLALVLLPFGWLAPPVAAQPEFAPVPADLVRDGRLTVKEYNFLVKAPGKEWQWLVSARTSVPPSRTYVCENRASGQRYVLTIVESNPDRENLDREGIMKGLRGSQEAKGRKVQAEKWEAVEVPVPSSQRYSFTVVTPDGPMYSLAYVVPVNRLYLFQMAAPQPGEPAEFSAFVRSFAFLAPPPAPLPPIPTGVTYLCLVLFFLGLGAVLNSLTRRPLLNGGRVALVCVLVLGTVRIWTLLLREPTGRKVGEALGEALIPLVVAIWADSRYSKKKAALAAQAAAEGRPAGSPPAGPAA